MGLIACRDCGKQHSDSAKCCPNCGATKPKNKVFRYLAGLSILALFAFGALSKYQSPILDSAYIEKDAINPSDGMQKIIDHSKVDQCWTDARSAKVGELQFFQEECKRLEQEFERKHNNRYTPY